MGLKLNKKLLDIFKTTKTTSDEYSYTCSYVNEINSKHIITAYYTSDKALNSEYKTPNFDSADVIGTKLTLSNGKIKIGAGVSKVKVSFTVFYNNIGDTAYAWAQLTKNNTNVVGVITASPKAFMTGTCSERIISVNENDLLSIKYNNPDYSTGNLQVRGGGDNTYITVEVVE